MAGRKEFKPSGTPPAWRKFHFERDKFKALILYFSKRGREEGLVIGSTKLNKLLFFTDFTAYAELGSPVTGAKYQKLEWGPAARAMLPVREEMVDEDAVEFEERPVDDLNDVLLPRVDPDLTLFSKDELRIADQVFEEMREYNARAISDLSHLKSAGWRLASEGEDIPYESVFVEPEPSDEAVRRGRELANRFGW